MANCPSSWGQEDGARKWIAKHLPRVSAKFTGCRDAESGVVLSWTDTAAAVAPGSTDAAFGFGYFCSILPKMGYLRCPKVRKELPRTL